MTEVRTTSSTGGEKGVKQERYDLLPREGLDAIARVFGFGAAKYADHNWRRRYEWSKSYSALMRHMTAFWSGETHDPESGLPHVAHAGFHVLVLLTWLERDGIGSEFDDRYVPDGESLEPDPNFAEVADQILAAKLIERGELPVVVEGDGEDAAPGVIKDLSEEDPADRVAREATERFGEDAPRPMRRACLEASDLLETRKRRPYDPQAAGYQIHVTQGPDQHSLADEIQRSLNRLPRENLRF